MARPAPILSLDLQLGLGYPVATTSLCAPGLVRRCPISHRLTGVAPFLVLFLNWFGTEAFLWSGRTLATLRHFPFEATLWLRHLRLCPFRGDGTLCPLGGILNPLCPHHVSILSILLFCFFGRLGTSSLGAFATFILMRVGLKPTF